MASALPALIGVAGGTYAAKRSVKTNSQHFNQRMQDAEKYGIHPLQAIGSAGTLQGTGGASIGSLIQNEQNSRKYYRDKKNSERREDRHRQEDRDHQMQMQQMKNSADDRRTTRSLEDDLRNGSQYIFQTQTPFNDAGEYIGDQIDKGINWYEMQKFRDRQRRLYRKD